jgi:YfiH family protein
MLIVPSIFDRTPEIVAGVSTRIGGVAGSAFGMNMSVSVGDASANVMANRTRFADALGISVDRIAYQKQVHGHRSVRIDVPQTVEACDALITTRPNVFLAVSVADCQPVLLYDRVHRVVAGVHAGWRGAAAHIVLKTLGRMGKSFGTMGHHVLAYVGPAASVCCYEVDESVASRFAPHVAHAKDNGHFMLDLKASTRLDLDAFGVPEENIEVSAFCTIHDADKFHSYRRDGVASGRMMAVVGIRQ